MKVVIINKSDRTGGAAIVSYRLMKALRQIGVDARMLVVEKLSDNYYVDVAASPYKAFRRFLRERLRIFLANGFNKADLFKVDIASDGLALHRHEWVREADVICLNWINQGMLSTKGIKKIASLGKPIVWTMHDMWNLTGICHHAGSCQNYRQECGCCKFLSHSQKKSDLSNRVWKRKQQLYSSSDFYFVAVSNWLAEKCKESSLLSDKFVTVIPNAFPINQVEEKLQKPGKKGIHKIIMGAARLDDSIKGFPIMLEATRILARKYPEVTSRVELITYGDIRNPEELEKIAIPYTHLGIIGHEKDINDLYRTGSVVLSTSHYETLPGTLIEGQAYGCIPVSFNHGGQGDIIEHLHTGYLAEYTRELHTAAERIAEGIVWAISQADSIDTSSPDNILTRLHKNVYNKFSAEKVARAYERLFISLLNANE